MLGSVKVCTDQVAVAQHAFGRSVSQRTHRQDLGDVRVAHWVVVVSCNFVQTIPVLPNQALKLTEGTLVNRNAYTQT
jgi:hypothetical protein